MNLKDKLKKIKEEIFAPTTNNRDFEFDANLVDHELGNSNVYRLHYVNYHRIGEGYCIMGPDNVGVIDWPFKPFILPRGMDRYEAFKVLSYLTDYIEEKANLEPCSEKSVATLNEVIDLERLGFTRLNINISKDETDIIDLFTVTGRLLLFKKSKYYPKYFEWYTEGVTLQEVKDIYDKCGIDFYDLETKNDEEKVLKNTYI